MKLINKKAYHEYNILETLEAGIRLTGPEVKSIRGGRLNLTGSFVRVLGNEAYVINMQIPPYEFARIMDYDDKRTRKLLIHKKELISLKMKLAEQGLTAVPLSVYTKQNLIKVEIGIVKGKKTWDKREALKKKDIQKDIDRALRNK